MKASDFGTVVLSFISLVGCSASDAGDAHGVEQSALADDGTLELSQKYIPNALLIPNSFASPRVGASVAFDGNVVLVGAPGLGSLLTAIDTGQAFVYRNASVPVSEATFTPRDGASGDLFGYAVAIAGDVAVVGAPLADTAGEDYIFRRSSNVWAEAQVLVPPDIAAGDRFGSSVAISGDSVAIGAVGRSSAAGAVYTYRSSSNRFELEQRLSAPGGAAGDRFGHSVALFSGTLLVGAPDKTVAGWSSAGAAFSFSRSGATWLLQQEIQAPSSEPRGRFGWSVALSSDTALISAPLGASESQGAVHWFTRSGTTWSPELTRSPLGTAPLYDSSSGPSVALSGNVALIGVGGNGTKLEVHRKDGGVWSRVAVSTTPIKDSLGGQPIAVSGDRLVVGNPFSLDDPTRGDPNGYFQVFDLSASTLTLVRDFVPTLSAVVQEFGKALAIQGDTAFVGAPNDVLAPSLPNLRGSLNIFFRESGRWWLRQRIAANDPAMTGFGSALAVSGDTTIVMGRGDTRFNSSLHVFAKSGRFWFLEQVIWPGPGSGNRQNVVDGAIAISGDTFIASNPVSGRSEVSVYTRTGRRWSNAGLPQIKPERFAEPEFGASVALSGNTAVVGQPANDTVAPDAGAAYVYVRVGNEWPIQTKLAPADLPAGARFGSAVAVSGDRVMVAHPGVAVYVFERVAATWTQTQKLLPRPGTRDFANYLVLSPTTGLVSGDRTTVLRAEGARLTEFQALDWPSTRQRGGRVALSETGESILVEAVGHAVIPYRFGTAEDACGDLVVGTSEQCDDGNRISGDGCSDYCWLEGTGTGGAGAGGAGAGGAGAGGAGAGGAGTGGAGTGGAGTGGSAGLGSSGDSSCGSGECAGNGGASAGASNTSGNAGTSGASGNGGTSNAGSGTMGGTGAAGGSSGVAGSASGGAGSDEHSVNVDVSCDCHLVGSQRSNQSPWKAAPLLALAAVIARRRARLGSISGR
jgi:cysteine-rich repeat protein